MALKDLRAQAAAHKAAKALTVDADVDIRFRETKGGKEYVVFQDTSGRRICVFASQTQSTAEFYEMLDSEDGQWPVDVKSAGRLWQSKFGWQITDKGSNDTEGVVDYS